MNDPHKWKIWNAGVKVLGIADDMSTKLIMLEALYYEKSGREISGKIAIITNVFLHQVFVIKKFTMRYKKVIALLQNLTRSIALIF